MTMVVGLEYRNNKSETYRSNGFIVLVHGSYVPWILIVLYNILMVGPGNTSYEGSRTAR